MNIEIGGENINEKDQQVLLTIYDICESEGDISSSLLRDEIPWLDETGKSSYRMNKLEQVDLIESWRDDSSVSNRLPPRIASITDFGKSVVESYDIRNNIDFDYEERAEDKINRLEKQLQEAEKKHMEIKAEIRSLKYQNNNLEKLVTVIQDLLEDEGIDVSSEWYARQED